MRAPARRHRQQGFSLLEVGVVLVILVILLVAALPAYGDFLVRKQLELASQSLVQDLRLARQASQIGQSNVFVSFRTGTQWCWGVNRGEPCDCGQPSSCNMSHMDGRDFKRIHLQRADALEFERSMGRALQMGGAEFVADKGAQRLRVEVSAMGRTQVCSDARC